MNEPAVFEVASKTISEMGLLLVHTGKSRLSGDLISRVMGAYQRDEQGVVVPNTPATACQNR